MKICLYLPFKYENTFNNAMLSAPESASAGKPGSRPHFKTSFGENVVVAETSYQMLEVRVGGQKRNLLQ